jgi:hypothetical protein
MLNVTLSESFYICLLWKVTINFRVLV